MNATLVILLVIIGGVTGLAVIGIAIYMMRQENAAERQENATGRQENEAQQKQNGTEDSPVDSTSSTATASQSFLDSSPMPIASVEPTLSPITPTPAPDPVAIAPPDPALQSEPTPPAWLNALAARSPGSPAVTEAPINPAPTSITPEQELLRLLRSTDGNLIVEINGQRHQTRANLNDERLEQQIANAHSDLNYFLNGPANDPVKATAPLVAVPAPPPVRKQPVVEARPVVKVSLQEAAQMEVKPPTMNILQQLRYVREQQKKPTVEIKSIMEEIDEILQSMIADGPLAQRGLKAADGSHGAVFTLDGVSYDSVDALPDAEAREMLRAAIQKWDQK